MTDKISRTKKFAEFVVKKLVNFIDKPDALTPDQSEVVEIIKLLLKNEETEVLWSPNDIRYIMDKDYFIKVENQRISIMIGDDFQTDVWFSGGSGGVFGSATKSIIEEIDSQIESRRELMEDQRMKRKTEKLLDAKNKILEEQKKLTL